MTDSREPNGAASAQEVWCQLEREGETVVRVGLMHPDGTILVSCPAGRFEEGLLRRMRAGHIQARLSAAGSDGSRTLWLRDDSDRVIFSEEIHAEIHDRLD